MVSQLFSGLNPELAPCTLGVVNSKSAADTEFSAPADTFATTHWSLVLRARDDSQPALESLFGQYRQPLLVWLRAQGYPPPEAEDLLHGFLHNLLRKKAFQGVASEKGRFRTFLLRCLKNHLRDEWDRKIAAKRGGGQTIESLDETNGEGISVNQPGSADATPDLEYDRAWARTVLQNSFRKLEQESIKQGRRELYAALEPVIFCDDTASPYDEIGLKVGMSEAAVKMAATRLRARLKHLVREEIMQTVANKEEWLEEVRYLIQLSGREAGT